MAEDEGLRAARRVLARFGRCRVIELREGGPDYEIHLSLARFSYDGAECIWMDRMTDWIAYAGHEASIAFGGILADGLRASWPRISQWGWSG